MLRLMKQFFIIQLLVVLQVTLAHGESGSCEKDIISPKASPAVNTSLASFSDSLLEWLKKKAIDKTLDVMAAFKGLPKYLARNQELKSTKRYLEYSNFGEMGLAELGISIRYNQMKFAALNTGKPLIIVANHPLGIADGLALQHLAARSRQGSPSLLFLARWVEKLLPHAVYGDEHNWGTAIPIEINKPAESDPDYETKMEEVNTYNSSWNRKSSRILRNGGALIIFPAGHVASMNNDGRKYPENVYDAPNSWHDGFLNLARLGKAEIVFAKIDSVNSEAFYKNRKRFGGGDKERIIWFFSEALAKKDNPIEVILSKPMGLEETYNTLSRVFNVSKEALVADAALTSELMRQFTYRISEFEPQTLDTQDSPQKITTGHSH